MSAWDGRYDRLHRPGFFSAFAENLGSLVKRGFFPTLVLLFLVAALGVSLDPPD